MITITMPTWFSILLGLTLALNIINVVLEFIERHMKRSE